MLGSRPQAQASTPSSQPLPRAQFSIQTLGWMFSFLVEPLPKFRVSVPSVTKLATSNHLIMYYEGIINHPQGSNELLFLKTYSKDQPDLQ